MQLPQQVELAVDILRGLFKEQIMVPEDPPPGVTVEELWEEMKIMREQLDTLRRAKRKNRPKVEQAARLILEDPRLTQIPIPMIAELIRAVFKSYGIDSSCSESSIRWYMSQRTLEWDIKKRTPPILEVLK